MKPVEIEIDGPRNEALSFRPLPGRRIRGRFDWNRVAEPMARIETTHWPQAIPGQRLGLDADGVGYVAEPLHDAEHAPIREKVQKAGMGLEPAVQLYESIDAASWLFWMKRAVAAGVARVVRGELPEKLPGKPRMDFINAEPRPTDTDRLTAALERQSALMEKLLERLLK